MNNHELSKIVDINKLIKCLNSEPPHVILSRWAETAREIEPERWKAIANIKLIYSEMSESELSIDRLLLFVEALLKELKNDENKSSLIMVQVPGGGIK